MKKFILFVVSCLISSSAVAFPTFDPIADASASGGTTYAIGSAFAGQVNAFGDTWSAVNSTALGLPICVSNINLTYPGLPASTGASIMMTNTDGKGVRVGIGSYPLGTPATLYYSFVMKVANVANLTTAAGGLFFAGFNNVSGVQASSVATASAAFFLRKSGSGYQIGMAKANAAPRTIVFDPTVHTTTETNFVVYSYQINNGSTTDDIAQLWVNPSSATFGTENVPPFTTNSPAGDADAGATIVSWMLETRGAGASASPNSLIMDDIRIGKTWTFITGGPEAQTPPVANTNVIYSSNVTLTVSARSGDGTAPGYRWQKNGVNLSDTGNISGSGTNALTITGVGASDAATYSVIITNTMGKITNSSVVNVLNPYIVLQPTNYTAVVGFSAAFSVAAIGTPALTYQWQRDGTDLVEGGNISGSKSASLNISPVGLGDAASYSCIVSNGLGSSTNSAGALLTVLATDPAFIANPANFHTNYGGTATFTAQALGSGTITYRWQSNGVDMADGPTGSGSTVSGSSSSTLMIANVSYIDAMPVYSVNATNGSGASVSSSSATLAVNDPFVSVPPASRTNVVGTAASFSVTAVGSPTLTYAWSKNGAPLSNGGTISGADAATLSISAVSNVDGGTYACTVGGGSGSNAVSALASLKVLTANPGEFLYWDGNGTTPGSDIAPQATWGTSNFWSVDSSGSVPTGVWLDGDTAVFSAGTDSAGSTYNVTVSGTQAVAGVRFEEANVTLAGGTLTMVGGGGQSIFDTADTLFDTINTTVIAGTNDFVKTGNGSLRLNGNPNTYTGRTVMRGGTLTSANETRFGTVPVSLVADNLKFDGGTLEWVPTGNQALSATRGLTVTANGGTINVDNTGTLSINGPITGPGALTILATVNTGNAVISSGSNSFTGGFTNQSAGITTTFQGPSMYLPGPFTVNDGTVIFSNGTNTIGNFYINGGQVRINAPNGVGAGVITMTGGTLRTTIAGTGSILVTNSIFLASGTPTLAPGGTGTQFGIQFSGIISGPGGLLRNSTGDKDMIFSGANIYSGGFTITDYYVNPGHKQAFGTGLITVGDPGAAPAHTMYFDPTINLTGANAITNAMLTHYQFSLSLHITTNSMEFSGPIELGDSVLGDSIPIYANNAGLVHIFSGVVSSPNGHGFEKRGVATLRLTGANTYPGGTLVTDGVLAADNAAGSATGSGGVTVNSPGILVGNGSIVGGVTNVSGTISAGLGTNAVGKLTLVGGLEMSAGGTYLWELGALKDDATGVAGVDFDQLAITGGNLSLGAPAALAPGFLAPASAPSITNSFWRAVHNWTVIAVSGGALNTGTAFGTIQNGASGAGVFSNSIAGSNIRLTFSPTPAPTISSITQSGGSATITWNAANLANYQLQFKTNLNQANWLVLSNLTGAGAPVSITDTSSDPRRFYRVALVP